MKEQKEIHIGSLIKEKMEERGLSVSDFAHALHYERTKLLQKREMRKDIVIELSYKGFSRASDYS